jgi:aspartate racemase
MTEASTPRCLGLIGGLGVGATVHYYLELAKAHAARGCVPNLVIIHADVNRVLQHAAAGETTQLAEYLSQLIHRLARAGAQLGVIPAVTPHISTSELVQLSPIPLVNLIHEIAREIQIRRLKRVSLFGTRFAMESQLFGQLPGVEVVLPSPEQIGTIHGEYLQLVSAGRGSEDIYQSLRQIAHTLCERDQVQAIILAGTELSMVFNEGNTDFPHIDGARVHLEAIMRELFAESA